MRLPVPRFLRGYRRSAVLFALVAFLVGNVGWPLPRADRSGGGCRVFAGRPACCCSDKALIGNCGCGKAKAPALTSTAKLPSCCQKRAQAAKRAAGVVVNCACGDSQPPGFVVSSLPKLYSASHITIGIEPAARLSILPAALFAELSFAPELPPPRVVPV